ncbi:hypothetical protein [Salegentibacter chungangensis]|uniref:Outer membrane protein beta-barrel domain-containing protein n=1 Tax=Salegentibacter chungangensis TaxID=1335724 RepID=A0ABW3NVQ9_9FLAO
MKAIIFYISLVLLSFSADLAQAQDSLKVSKEDYYEKQKEKIVKDEREELKVALEEINRKLENDQLSPYEADKMREEVAEKHALNINNRIAILENELELERRNRERNNYKALGGKGKVLDVHIEKEEEKYDRRTYSDIVLAAGFNNALAEGQSLNDSDFKIGGSRFFEIGWAWKTRVFENSNWLRVKYGFSFQFNGLKPTNNRYFVEDGDQTFLEEFPLDLKKSKFRTDNLIFPVHFELGPSVKNESETSIRYSTSGKFKIGLGGYAGFNIGERQKLKYREDGEKVKEKLKGDYNTSDFVYGLSGYLGWGGATLYAKYDLNPVFQDNPVELHNISLGLRFDVD